ncbi:MAG: GAF domain-containing sensor histidine kinase [Candidatus Dormiibacterota bacterium]
MTTGDGRVIPRASKRPWNFWLALALWAATVVIAIADLVLVAISVTHSVDLSDLNKAPPLRIELPLFGLGFASVGALIASRLRGNLVGWLFLGIGVQGALQSLGVESGELSVRIHGGLPLASTAEAISANTGRYFFETVFTFILLVYPSGRFLSRAWTLIGAVTALTLVFNLIDQTGSLPGPTWILSPLGVLLAVAAVASVIVRYRRGGREERQQIKLLLYAGIVVLTFVVLGPFIAFGVFTGASPAVVTTLLGTSFITILLIPAAAAIAIMKYRLYDIDVVISRTLVYGALAVFITAVYVGIVVGVGTLVGSGGQPNLVLSIVATAIVAVAFQPVRERLQKIANRLVYGKRATPYEVLSQFSEQVAETYAADEALPRMARVLAEGTGSERATVWLRGGNALSPAAQWPSNNGSAPAVAQEPVPVSGQLLPELPGDRAVAVLHQGKLLGALTVRKRPGESLTPVEEKLLTDLAAQAGLVLKNVGLTAELLQRLEELRTSRQRLVAAQDEERRRLERNLHDGAQQNLVAIKVKLGLVEAFADKDPARAREMMVQLKGDTDDALETLRDLARGIYPPLLADKGLAAALEAQARKATVPVEISADGIGRYSQDIEAAVYFCVLEALQNIQKYAQAQSARVHLAEVAGALTFDVADDGQGFDASTVKRGAGLTNMADRLDALGGTVDVQSAVGAGSTLRGQLPVMVAMGITVAP